MSAIPGYLQLDEVARRLGKSYPQAAKYVRDGDLPHIKVGASKLVPASALDDFHPRPPGNPEFQRKKKPKKKSA